MPKMTNSAAKKRLQEAYDKCLKVHFAHGFRTNGQIVRPLSAKDMQALERILTKAMNKL
mgnify:FL=1